MIGIRPTNSQVGRVGYGYIYINQQMSLGMYVYLSKMGKHDQIYCNLWNSLGKINSDGCGWRSPNMLFCCSQNCHWKITCNATYNASDDTANTRRIRYWIPAEKTVLEQRPLPLIHESMVNLWLTKKQLLLVGWWCSIKDISTINHAQSLMVHQKN